MRRKLAALWLALLMLLSGCAAAPEEMTAPVRFYGTAEDGTEYARPSGALSVQTVDLGNGSMEPEQVLAQYLSQTRDGTFPEGLECLETRLEDGVLRLTFNEAFADLSGVELTLATAALTLTMTQLEGVDGVRICCRKAILSENWQEVFTKEDFLLLDTSPVHPEYMAQLYFLAPEGQLEARRRAISYGKTEELPELVIQELLDGPGNSDVTRAIPDGTELVDLSMDGTRCNVVLSDAFAGCDTDEVSARRAVGAVVLTLCALDLVEDVQLQILGGVALKHFRLDAPLSGENWPEVR